MMYKILIKIHKYNKKITHPPAKPNSSEKMLKIKSVLCCGKNRKWL